MYNHIRTKSNKFLFIRAFHNLVLHRIIVRYFLKYRPRFEESLLSYKQLKRNKQVFYYFSETSLLSYYKLIYKICTKK